MNAALSYNIRPVHGERPRMASERFRRSMSLSQQHRLGNLLAEMNVIEIALRICPKSFIHRGRDRVHSLNIMMMKSTVSTHAVTCRSEYERGTELQHSARSRRAPTDGL